MTVGHERGYSYSGGGSYKGGDRAGEIGGTLLKHTLFENPMIILNVYSF